MSLLSRYCESGDPADFAAIVTAFGVLVYAECRRVTRNAHDAEDAAQLTFLAFAIELRSGTVIRSPLAWLQQVSKRQALKIVRSRGRRKRREDAARVPLEVAESSSDTVNSDQMLTSVVVRDAIDALPDRYRLPIVLHYFGGMSLEAIATELKISRTAAGTRLHRARKALAKRLDARGLSFDAGTLSTVMAAIIPASVIANLIRSSSIASEHAPVMLAHHVGALMKVSSQITAPRLVALLMISLSASGTAMGWRQILTAIDQVGSKKLLPMFDRFFAPAPYVPSLPRISTPIVSASTPSAFPGQVPEVDFANLFDPPRVELAAHRTEPLNLRESTSESEWASTSNRSPSTFVSSLQKLASPAFELPKPYSRSSSDWSKPPLSARTFPFSSYASDNAFPSSVGSRDSVSTPRLDIASKRGESAGLLQSGGLVQTEALIVGHGGRGSYDLTGGRLEVGSLAVGLDRGSEGVLRVAGGELRITNSLAPTIIGGQGIGQLLLGSENGPGRMLVSGGRDSQFIIRATPEARGEVRGWGEISSRGTLVNNGRVVADGHGQQRELDLSSFDDVTNTIENPKGGKNGWYAQNGGVVVLPPIKVQPGTHSYNWGESRADTKIDLVNSVQVRLVDQRTTGRLSISLISTDYAPVNLPVGSAVYSLWSFNAAQYTASSADLTVVYDSTAASSLTYHAVALQLLTFTNGSWNTAHRLVLDTDSNILSGSVYGSFSYFAVAGLKSTVVAANNAGDVHYIQPVIIVPEPTSAAVLMTASLLLHRRRRGD